MVPLLDALDADDGQARFVGGAVRDTLLGHEVQDVDIATRMRPDQAMQRMRAARIKVVPTGIDHGTVTAILPGGPIEVTTLRRDVSTDGRRATVAFSDDWREDAARRDFTINALYADPASGEIFDYFGGAEDLAAGRIRFIGDALTRIAEDHLRILRFFRFHARFGTGAPDTSALAACRARARDLMALSRERIADELLKLLGLPDPAPTIALMIEADIFSAIIPEIGPDSLVRLKSLISNEREAAIASDALRRLIALVPANADKADAIAARLKLSNAQRKRIGIALGADECRPRELLYRWGAVSATDRLLLSQLPADEIVAQVKLVNTAERPRMPIGGGTLVARGLVAGPVVAKALQEVERRWIDEDFPDAARISAIADDVVAQALRSRK
ncbi:CCA tRNA nucleotidyltransferase [Sphingomonas cavernae]|uniref:CCA tRNA nucleotidyltransferase n=1 Tax=Sphingomonas cavernae TaxID=2320861 RepID=A0A418WNF6_9SPHN|nr:CCA tRNA nucleotidyltransferase [Sphingomonas cavernae]RJF91517.1 CCA tRNA nucleotidyltransferase [Sphingomonas cavernae]